MNHWLRSCISPLFDLPVELRAIFTSFIPSSEYISRIGVKLALPFSPPLHFGKCSSLEPHLKSTCTEMNTMSDFNLLEALRVKGNHLLIAVIALCPPCQTITFCTPIRCRFPGFRRKRLDTLYKCLSRFWRDFLLQCGFSMFANLCTTTG